jgi:hypothetical protein
MEKNDNSCFLIYWFFPDTFKLYFNILIQYLIIVNYCYQNRFFYLLILIILNINKNELVHILIKIKVGFFNTNNDQLNKKLKIKSKN